MQTLGEHLRAARERTGKSQHALAADLEVAPATVNRYENNVREPGIGPLIALAAALGVIIVITSNGVSVKPK